MRNLSAAQHIASPITDDEYRNLIYNNAFNILIELFKSTPTSFRELQSLDVLVIGAGMFPSYLPFVETLTSHLPFLKELNFTLIEPQQWETERFAAFLDKIKFVDEKLKVTYSTHNVDVKEYLQTACNTNFDVIYFEQPDLSPIGILLAKHGNASAKLELSLRESIPYLSAVIHSQSIIVASFLFKRDLVQLNALINFSLNIPTRVVSVPRSQRTGSPYHSGLISIVDPLKLIAKEPEKIELAIKQHDTYYSWCLMLSLLLFLFTPTPSKLASLYFTIILLFHHRYGLRNLAIKIIILLAQICVMAIALSGL